MLRVFLDKGFEQVWHLSYTSLQAVGGVHSGDITEAPAGASEFIDIELDKVKATYIVPSVNLYSGESFEDAAESFFGFMMRTPEQKGKPFEAATVKAKFDMRGKGKVALPIAFMNDGGSWKAKWLNLYIKGYANFNRVENNRLSTSLVARSIIERDYLTISYLAELLSPREFKTFQIGRPKSSYEIYTGHEITEPVTYIGLETPEGLPNGSGVYNLSNLHKLIPE